MISTSMMQIICRCETVRLISVKLKSFDSCTNVGSVFQSFVRVECLKDLTQITEMKASSRQSMIASLTGNYCGFFRVTYPPCYFTEIGSHLL